MSTSEQLPPPPAYTEVAASAEVPLRNDPTAPRLAPQASSAASTNIYANTQTYLASSTTSTTASSSASPVVTEPKLKGLKEPMAIVNKNFCLGQKVRLYMRQNGDEAKIIDESDRVWFKLDGKATSFKGKRDILDKNGKVVCALNKQLMSVRGIWNLYKGDSTDNKDRVATFEPKLFADKPEIKVYLSDGDREPDFAARGDFVKRCFDVSFLLEDQKEVVVARCQPMLAAGKTDSLMVTIGTNLDIAMVIAICVCIDEAYCDGLGAEKLPVKPAVVPLDATMMQTPVAQMHPTMPYAQQLQPYPMYASSTMMPMGPMPSQMTPMMMMPMPGQMGIPAMAMQPAFMQMVPGQIQPPTVIYNIANLTGFSQPCPVVHQRFCLPTFTRLFLKEQPSFSGDDFDIFDEAGQVWFRMDAKSFSITSKRTLLDASHNAVCMLDKQLLSIRGTWSLYRGTSTTKADRLATFEPKILTTRPNIKIYLSDGDREPDYAVRGDFNERNFDVSFINQGQETLVARCTRITRDTYHRYRGGYSSGRRSSIGKPDTYMMTVAPNVDVALMTAICLTVDEVYRDEGSSAAAAGGIGAVAGGVGAVAAAAAITGAILQSL